SYTTSNCDIAFVFDCSSLRTGPYPQITILGIGHVWYKKYLHALVRHNTANFREFHIITYQKPNFSTIRIKYLDFISANHPVVFELVRRNVNLFMYVQFSITMAQIRCVIKFLILPDRHRSGDDIDIRSEEHTSELQ